MHLISNKKLRAFAATNPEAESPLKAFRKIVEKTDFKSFAHLRETFPSADLVDKRTVFNIGGRKFRLIAAIHYNTKKFYVIDILTHQRYNEIHWQDG